MTDVSTRGADVNSACRDAAPWLSGTMGSSDIPRDNSRPALLTMKLGLPGLVVSALIAGACSSDSESQDTPTAPSTPSKTFASMDFSEGAGFYAAPFPSAHRHTADGRVDLAGFPNPKDQKFVTDALAVITEAARGFGLSTAAYFQLDGEVDVAQFPSVTESVETTSPIFLVSVDEDSADFMQRYPIHVDFRVDGGPYGAQNLLSTLPLQGVPLRPNTQYATVVLRELVDDEGIRLGVSSGLSTLLAGQTPDGMSPAAFAAYDSAIAALAENNVARDSLAAIGVFTTGDPALAMQQAAAAVLKRAAPTPDAPATRVDIYDAFCAYKTTIAMPVYQAGEPPFSKTGGGWIFDETGAPIHQADETANLVVTIPRTPMPESGFPTVVASRTGMGGEKPLVDRGVHLTNQGANAEPGRGPGHEFARVGWAGVSVDGPHGGIRNVSGGDEQLLMFNFTNMEALRDNIRQSAVELALVPEILRNLSIDVSDCPGAEPKVGDATARFDTNHLVLFGHSMGATIAPLTLAYQPAYEATILSGAGAGYIENILFKQKPIPVLPLAEAIVGYAGTEYSLHRHDPALTLTQWAGEPADSFVYTEAVVRQPIEGPSRHVLMLQGIVDHYIMPTIANAMSLSLGLDLAGPALDEDNAEIAEFASFASWSKLMGFDQLDLPVNGNQDHSHGTTTAVVVQFPGDDVEDGHETVFQTEAPKNMYRCFLESLIDGTPDAVSRARCAGRSETATPRERGPPDTAHLRRRDSRLKSSGVVICSISASTVPGTSSTTYSRFWLLASDTAPCSIDQTPVSSICASSSVTFSFKAPATSRINSRAKSATCIES